MAGDSFYTKVAGVTAKNADGMNRQSYVRTYCKVGMPLILRREADNPHDANAVGVWVKVRALLFFTSEVQIGYLGRDVARRVARKLDAGKPAAARIVDVTGGSAAKPFYGVNIEVEM